MAGRSLIVSLHDVAPPTWDVSRKIIADLKQQGIRACALLVVPDYHHSGPSLHNASFVSWLRELQAEGHEIVIHGYFHERPRTVGESLVNQFLTRIYTQDEGEFFDLEYNEARRRISCARQEFADAGLKPHGFVAPAWLLGEEAERAARDAGMEYTTRLASVRDLVSGDTFQARSLVYSVGNAWRRQASLCWNGMLAQLAAPRNSLVRLSIHPVDYMHATIWSQICRFVIEMRSERFPTTYHDWIGEWRIRRNVDL